jgi:hypothetical protein
MRPVHIARFGLTTSANLSVCIEENNTLPYGEVREYLRSIAFIGPYGEALEYLTKITFIGPYGEAREYLTKITFIEP